MKHISQRVAEFTDRYPLLGPLVWILSLQYFVFQFLAASAWWPPYSWSRNAISDLGNTVCGLYSGRFVCSPDHGLMNASFILLGVTMALGSLFIYQEFKESRTSFIGFTLMAAAGLGTFMVGIFPENVFAPGHYLGAFLAFAIGNVSLVILSLALKIVRQSFRIYTFVSGVVTLAAFALFLMHTYLGLGEGGMERVVSYPQTIWLVMFGLYMTASHYRQQSALKGASAKR